MNNGSVVDYLNSVGQKSDYASRTQLAKTKGITNYTGTADQNVTLLNMLKGGAQLTPQATVQPTQQPRPTAQAPVVQPMQQPTTLNQPGISFGAGPSSAQDLVNQGFYGYQGWDNASALANFRETGGAGKGGPTASGAGGVSSFFKQPSIDLPSLYTNLYNTSGISTTEAQLTDKTSQYNEAVSKIKDNPYLSEATMSGRLSKLSDKFNADAQNIKNDIAMKKADLETKLNLQTKQFDIENQQSQQAIGQFNSLLSSGSLDNISGEDIANITRATGISSGVIQSAIKNSQQKGMQTSIQSYDDGINQGVKIITIDKFGNVTNTKNEVIAASKTATGINIGGGSAGTGWEEVTGQTGASGPSPEGISAGWDASSGSNPTFNSGGQTGSVWSDPSSGKQYQYSVSGWQPMG